MNILHLQLTGNPGGIVSLTRDIANTSKNNNIMYFLFEGGTVADAIAETGHKVAVDDSASKKWIQMARRLNEFCKKNDVDVIINHVNAPVAIFITAYVKRRNKNIKWIMYFHSSPEDLSLKRKILFKPFVQYQIRHANASIAISEFVKKSAERVFNVDANKIHVVYNGVDTSRFSAKEKAVDHQVKFIYVGRLFPNKGIQVLLDAIDQIKDIPGFHVDIVGGGPQKEELEEKARTLGLTDTVTFLGSRMDVPDLLATADYFVHPAIWNEGFGITLIEAMSAGLPCIAFKRGAIPEIISNGENGFIIDNIDAQDLANMIKRCVELSREEQYEKMSANAISTADKFNITNMVNALETIIERC